MTEDGLRRRGESILRGSLTYVVGTTVDRALAFALLPALAGFLSQSEVGVFNLAVALTTVLSMALSLGAGGVINYHYYRFDDPEERAQFLGSFWMAIIGFSAGVAVLLTTVSVELVTTVFPGLPAAPEASLAVWDGALRGAFFTFALGQFKICGSSLGYATFSVVTSAAGFAASFVLAVPVGLGATGAIAGQLVVSVVAMVFVAVWQRRLLRVNVDLDHVRAAMAFGLPLVPHLAGQWILNAADRAVIDHYRSLEEVANYSIVYAVTAGLALVLQAADKSLHPLIARAASGDGEALSRLPATFGSFLGVVLILSAAAVLAVDDVVVLLFPAEYDAEISLVAWLVFGMAALGFYMVPLKSITFFAARTRIVPVLTGTAAAVNIGLNLLLVPGRGIVGAAIATAAGYLMLAGGVWLVGHRVDPMPVDWSLVAVGGVIAVAVFGVGSGLEGPGVVTNLIVAAAITAVGGGAFYLLVQRRSRGAPVGPGR